MFKYVHDIHITLIEWITINESIYLSLLTEANQLQYNKTQCLEYIANNLSPFLSRTSINNLRLSLKKKQAIVDTPTHLEAPLDINQLPSPPQNIKTIKWTVWRPNK